jgi:hypothetical protein
MSRVIIAARILRLSWRRSLEHRASCVVVATRTSTDIACSPALEVPPPRGFEAAAACPHKGPASDRGTSATARWGNRVTATGLGTAATAQGRCRHSPAWEPPPPHIEVGEPRPPQPLVGVHRRARYRATAVANESRWNVKNWSLALRIFFYRRLDLVQLDRITLSDLSFL